MTGWRLGGFARRRSIRYLTSSVKTEDEKYSLVMLSIRMEPKIIVTAWCIRCGEENDSD